MICTAVPREAIDIVWGDVSGMLNKAIQTSKGKYHIDDIYHDLTKPLINFYKLKNILFEVNGENEIEDVFSNIINKL